MAKNTIQVLYSEKQRLRAFPKLLLFLEGCIVIVCAFIHAWLDDFTHPMPLGKDPPLPYQQIDRFACILHDTHPLFPNSPPFLIYTLTHKRHQNMAVHEYSLFLVSCTLMCAREQNAMMVCSQTQLYGSVHRFMGLIIWTHSHHTSDSYLQLWFILVPSHYCFGSQNIEIRKEKWLFGWISSSRKLQRPSFNR